MAQFFVLHLRDVARTRRRVAMLKLEQRVHRLGRNLSIVSVLFRRARLAARSNESLRVDLDCSICGRDATDSPGVFSSAKGFAGILCESCAQHLPHMVIVAPACDCRMCKGAAR